MNVLVTGGAGYIGSHFTRDALAAGLRPVVYDNLSMGHRWAVLSDRFHEADLADTRALEHALTSENIEAVVHFASYIFVGESVESPMKYFENNYVGTLNLINAMVRAGVKRLVFSSTAAVYGMPESVPIAEDAPKDPINPYGMTKYFMERTLEAYAHAYGLKYVCLRYFNAAGADPEARIGEAHNPETHLIPRVLEAAMGRRDKISVFGTDYPTHDGTCIRDYIHVCDLSRAHTLALRYLETGGESGAFNLGSSTGYSVRQIIEAVKRVTGVEPPIEFGPRRAGDPPELIASSEKARRVLGWQAQYDDIETIVGHAWQWIRRGYDMGYIRPPDS